MTGALPERSYQARRALLDRLAPTSSSRFDYINADTAIVDCPRCGGALTVRFCGTAPEADLRCQRGCAERAIVATMRARSK